MRNTIPIGPMGHTAHIACLLALLGSGACTDYVTTGELRGRAELVDKRVTVRGWAALLREQTLVGCSENNPCCNSAKGRLWLSPVPFVPGQWGLDQWNDSIEVDTPACAGSECEIQCTPFNPTSAPAFQMVGTLRRTEYPQPYDLRLEEIDLDASRALVGDGDLGSLDERAIEQGTFAVRSGR